MKNRRNEKEIRLKQNLKNDCLDCKGVGYQYSDYDQGEPDQHMCWSCMGTGKDKSFNKPTETVTK
jgi:hypothetical protein